MSYFEVAPPGHTIAYEKVENLFLKNGQYIFWFFLCNLNYDV